MNRGLGQQAIAAAERSAELANAAMAKEADAGNGVASWD